MDERARALIGLSAALSAGRSGGLTEALERAAAHADDLAVEEVLLQSYLFLGYPAAMNALVQWRDRTDREAGSPAPDDWAGWRRRGERVCETVYGGEYDRLRRNVARLHPDLERWMIVEGYGKVLGRPGLDLRLRELCIAALLAGLDARPQLHAHLRGALNAGATVGEVEDALALAARSSGPISVWAHSPVP